MSRKVQSKDVTLACNGIPGLGSTIPVDKVPTANDGKKFLWLPRKMCSVWVIHNKGAPVLCQQFTITCIEKDECGNSSTTELFAQFTL